jgi:phosphate transport system protein
MFDWIQNLRDPESQDRLMTRFQDMLSDGRHMFDSSVTILASGGDPASVREEVFKTDKRINENEQALRRELVVHGIVHGTSVFPMLLVMMSLAKDAERIGDYAKNLLDLARHRTSLSDDDHKVVAELGQQASRLLQEAASIFRDKDEEAARAFLEKEAAFRHECESRVDAWIETPDRNCSAACLCARFIKRVAGHAGNVVSSVCMPLDKLDFHPNGGGDED